MKEIPILLQTDMVKATMVGRKTETRRTRGLDKYNEKPNDYFLFPTSDGFGAHRISDFESSHAVKCPYGKPGDILWVRETFLRLDQDHIITSLFSYRADCDKESDEYRKEYVAAGRPYQWKPSIHMPKAVARIWLEVLDVKIELLWDITENGAIAEGVEQIPYFGEHIYRDYTKPVKPNTGCVFPQLSFRTLWQSINGPASWDENPWVWVVKFKVLSITGRPIPTTQNQ